MARNQPTNKHWAPRTGWRDSREGGSAAPALPRNCASKWSTRGTALPACSPAPPCIRPPQRCGRWSPQVAAGSGGVAPEERPGGPRCGGKGGVAATLGVIEPPPAVGVPPAPRAARPTGKRVVVSARLVTHGGEPADTGGAPPPNRPSPSHPPLLPATPPPRLCPTTSPPIYNRNEPTHACPYSYTLPLPFPSLTHTSARPPSLLNPTAFLAPPWRRSWRVAAAPQHERRQPRRGHPPPPLLPAQGRCG